MSFLCLAAIWRPHLCINGLHLVLIIIVNLFNKVRGLATLSGAIVVVLIAFCSLGLLPVLVARSANITSELSDRRLCVSQLSSLIGVWSEYSD